VGGAEPVGRGGRGQLKVEPTGRAGKEQGVQPVGGASSGWSQRDGWDRAGGGASVVGRARQVPRR
jgi:hypothetical protein